MSNVNIKDAHVVRLLSMLLFLFMVLTSCNKGGEKSPNVHIETSGIFNGITIAHEDILLQPVTDLGEYLLGSGPRKIAFKVRNNSLFSITDMNLALDGDNTTSWSFEKDLEGLSKFPGKSGTCGRTLLPAESCDIVIQFETNIKGFYTQGIYFNYTNLVEKANRYISLTILAGNPASLVFEDDQINYWFGDKVGNAKIPVVEREYLKTYEKWLTVTNQGDLRARNINLELINSCSSKLTLACPASLENAYVQTNDCPIQLLHGESCKVKVIFTPRNQDSDPASPNPEFKNVTFSGRVKINYETSMYKTPGSLNGYFTTVSTNIEASFETAIEKMNFEDVILVGNRDRKAIKVNNRGYRSGYLTRLLVKDLDGNAVASCLPQQGTTILQCVDPTTFTALTLSQFSFYLNDKDNCLADATEPKVLIPVDGGCVFEVNFQPSTTFQTPLAFDFKLVAEFDSRWKDQEAIVRSELFDVGARSLNAAKLVFQNVKLGSKNLTATMHLNDADVFLGRLALLSKNSFFYQKLSFTIKNVGGHTAKNVILKDGKNVVIPFKKEGVINGVNLGTHPGYWYFKNVFITTDGCNEIVPEGVCAVSMDFAPIHLDTEVNNYNNMYDVYDIASLPDARKLFQLSYTSGAAFTDTNLLNEAPDYPDLNLRLKLGATLVMKGVLQDYLSPSLLFQQIQDTAIGNDRFHTIRLKNIGTKTIPYIPYARARSNDPFYYKFKIVPKTEVPNPSALRDCYGILDFNSVQNESYDSIKARYGNVDPPSLAQDEECALSFKLSALKEQSTLDLAKLGSMALIPVSPVAIDRNPRWDSEKLWNLQAQASYGFSFSVDYFDGDYSDFPGTGGALQPIWGNRNPAGVLNLNTFAFSPAKVVPILPLPTTSAFIVRPGFQAPDLLVEDGSTYPSTTIPELRTFGPKVVPELWNPNIVRAIASASSINPGTSLFDPSQDDYLYFAGTFIPGNNHNLSFSLANAGKNQATQIAFSLQNLDGANAFSLVTPPNQNMGLGSVLPDFLSGREYKLKFSPPASQPSDPEEVVYRARFNWSYFDGVFINRINGPFRLVERSMIVAAVVKKTHPVIKAYSVNILVDPQDNTVPTETYFPPAPLNLSWNQDSTGAADAINITTVKVANRTNLDHYDRKGVIFRNEGTVPVNKFSFLNRTSTSSVTEFSALPSSISRQIFLCDAGTPTGSYSEFTNCPTFSGDVLNVGKELRVLYTYKAGTADSPLTLIGSLFYEVGVNQSIANNMAVIFTPKDPASVFLAERPSKTIKIRYAGDVTVVNSQVLDIGDTMEMLTLPQNINFDQATGVFKILRFNNTSTTGRASFLRTYHLWANLTDKTAVPPYDASGYALIYQSNYSGGSPRIRIYANQYCLEGDITDVPLARQRGFYTGTSQPCLMKVNLMADLNYIGKRLDFNNPDEMTPNFIQLQYYNNERSSFSTINIHMEGQLVPNRVLLPSKVTTDKISYRNVKVNPDRTARFSFFLPAARNEDLGFIVGYRVYYSSNTTEFATLSTAVSAYQDVMNPGLDAEGAINVVLSNLQTSRRYFTRVVAIRKHSNYTRNSYKNLSGMYLSEIVKSNGTRWNEIKYMVPPNHMFYDYENNALVDRELLQISQYRTYTDAAKDCTYELEDVFIGSNSTKYKMALITVPIWNEIVLRPQESPYDVFSKPHWLTANAIRIDTFFAPYPSYKSNVSTGYVDEAFYFYAKGSGCGSTCTGRQAAGASPLGKPNYNSLMFAEFPGALPRCYLNIP